MHPDLDQQRSLARRLREMPDEAAPPYDWSEFQRRSGARTRPGQRLAGGRALAAATVLALGVVAVWTRLGGWSAQPASVAAAHLTPEAAQPLAAHTSAMEHWLASLPSEPAVVHVGTRAAVTGLEDRIAQVDDLLSAERLDQAQPARLLALQQARTRLVGALVQVRYAETLADESR
jgi:Tfp pilus assembly protein PilN